MMLKVSIRESLAVAMAVKRGSSLRLITGERLTAFRIAQTTIFSTKVGYVNFAALVSCFRFALSVKPINFILAKTFKHQEI